MSDVSRRDFFVALSGITFGLAQPELALAPINSVTDVSTIDRVIAGTSIQPELMPVVDKIRELETLVSRLPDFSWWAHNELRHQYGFISDKMSRLHSELILRHSIMDKYVLNTLSEWHLNYEPADIGTGIATLLHNAETYSEFPHLKAACMIKAGDVYKTNGLLEPAYHLYEQVLELGKWNIIEFPTLKAYHRIAQIRLLLYS